MEYQHSDTEAAERGCGVREPGGVYAVTELSKRGRPLEDFLLDPGVPVAQVLGTDDAIPNRGVLVQQVGDHPTHHVFDKVGAKHYPNVLDFIEEVRRHGLSRRLPSGPQLAKLSNGSVILLAHDRAVISNVDDYYREIGQEAEEYTGALGLCCPTGKHHLGDMVEDMSVLTCAGLWWEDVTKGERLLDPTLPPRTVQRAMPGWYYSARQRPEGIKPSYIPGFFLKLPISKLVVIHDETGGSHEEALAHAGTSGLPVILADS